MDSVFALLKAAISRKEQVFCMYRRHRRELCPHVLGTTKGKLRLLAFQFGGSSSSGLAFGGEWRCMDVDQMSDISTRAGDWHTDSTHTKTQTCVDQVEIEVR